MAWLLLAVIVLIVIAPSVDLQPTALRAGRLGDLIPLFVIAACVSMGLASLLRAFFGRAHLATRQVDSSLGDLVIMVCTLRC